MKSGRLVAFLLMGAGALLVVLGVAWLGGGIAEGRMRITGALIGGILLAGLAVPLFGGGIYLLMQSRQEAAEDVEQEQLRKILDIVKTRGQVPVSDLAIELGVNRQEIQDMIHRLVGMGVFSGYVHWEEGVLYSEDAAGLRELDRCKHCGGELEIAGKGVVTCPYCGTEYFLN